MIDEGPVVHGDDSDWLLKLPTRSEKEPATAHAPPVSQSVGTESLTSPSSRVRVAHSAFTLIGTGDGEPHATKEASSSESPQTVIGRDARTRSQLGMSS